LQKSDADDKTTKKNGAGFDEKVEKFSKKLPKPLRQCVMWTWERPLEATFRVTGIALMSCALVLHYSGLA